MNLVLLEVFYCQNGVFPSRCHKVIARVTDSWGFLFITVGPLPYNIKYLELTVVIWWYIKLNRVFWGFFRIFFPSFYFIIWYLLLNLTHWINPQWKASNAQHLYFVVLLDACTPAAAFTFLANQLHMPFKCPEEQPHILDLLLLVTTR